MRQGPIEKDHGFCDYNIKALLLKRVTMGMGKKLFQVVWRHGRPLNVL